MLNVTQIPAPRVALIDERTGLLTREWYRFFYNLYTLTGGGTNAITLEELQLGPPNQPDFTEILKQVNNNISPEYQDQSGNFLATLDAAQLMAMMARFENLEAAIQGAYLQPPLAPVDGVYVVGPSSATDNAIARFDGTTGKLIQNSVTTIDDTGNAAGILSQQFSDGTAVALAAGKMWYDGTTGAWNAGMGGGNITQQIGEEIFVYGKASAAITDSPLQIIYHTGTVGASGVITFAPTIAGITDVNSIVGIATESLALNGFGRATSFGVVRGITTNGTAFGEVWADDDVIWYNPVTGNPTKVEPVAPYIKVQVGLVIRAGAGGSGSFQVGIVRGSKLGGTDSNVQFSALANNNLITYDTGVGYWKNTTTGTGVVTALGVNVGTAGSVVINGGALGTPSSGTVTNLTGTASININGTVGATTANTGAFTTLSTTDNITPLTAAKGVNFTANTPAAGMTSQLLNWYEEGTYTPTLVGGTTAGTTTYTTQVGFYTRIGNRVTFDLTIIYTAATGTGEARLSLPSTANSASGYIAVVIVRTTIPSSAGYSLVGGINAGAAYARYVTYDGLTGALTTQPITSGSYTIRLSGTYFV